MTKYVKNPGLPYELLMRVEKPARYIGNEINIIRKSADTPVRFCFCFPDAYEIGMSHLGLQIIYFMLNGLEGCCCERAFTPWIDMEKIMREESYPLYSLESYSPLKTFDILGFTLQYEMSYTNILTMLDLSGIPFYSAERDESFPVICAGGPCAYNPEPLAEFFDFFYLGEAETVLPEIIEIYKENKRLGCGKADFLHKLLFVPGVYVPKYYDVKYHVDGTIKSFEPNHPDAPPKIRKNIVNDLSCVFYPEKQLVPLLEAVHDRITLELFRGCLRGCRFCQAGFVYRPVRETPCDKLLCSARALVSSTGHEEISLVSLSSGDYSDFKKLTESLIDEFSKDKINLALPSLRIDAFNLELMSRVQSVRRASLTFAPEAGTQRLRDVINKNLSKEEILAGAKLAFLGGWDRVKLYFMVGLPTETYEDLDAIAFLGEDVVKKFFEVPPENRRGGVSVVMSASCFVPKPFTPFQWEPQDIEESFTEKCRYVKKIIRRKQIRFNYHEAGLSVLEGVFARGGRPVSRLLLRAYELGCRFDAWSDMYKPTLWNQAYAETGITPEFYAARRRPFGEILPWDFIDIGVDRDFLRSEAEKAYAGITTPDCRSECSVCGAACFGGGVCHER